MLQSQLHMVPVPESHFTRRFQSAGKVLGIVSLLSGICIYLIYRKPTGIYQSLLLRSGLEDDFPLFRQDHSMPPAWMTQILPDALWMFSFSILILWIWGFQRRTETFAWVMIAMLLGSALEFLQYTGTLPGRFDVWDLGAMILAALLPLCFTIKSKTP